MPLTRFVRLIAQWKDLQATYPLPTVGDFVSQELNETGTNLLVSLHERFMRVGSQIQVRPLH